MDSKAVLEKVKRGDISIDEALRFFERKPFEDMDFAKLDMHRAIRTRCSEVVLCEGKPDEYIVSIFLKLIEADGEVLGTRASQYQFELIKKAAPDIEYDPLSHTIMLEKKNKEHKGNVVICTGGTSDIPVAEEAAKTVEFFGGKACRVYDVGVTGLHRVLAEIDDLQKANCVIAVAGMEGALASVVGGLVSVPVIAVPTSVGYGASFQGLSALLTMLNSCANGIATVNIDNGYGAGYIATQINRLAVNGRYM